MRRRNQQSRVLYELSDLVLNILRCPPTTLQFSDQSPAMSPPPFVAPSRRPSPQITPVELVFLLLGISTSLMLCGSVTFFLGFFLMPWVIGLAVVLYFVGIISSLTMLGRAILCHTKSPPKEIPRKYFFDFNFPAVPISFFYFHAILLHFMIGSLNLMIGGVPSGHLGGRFRPGGPT